MIILSSLLSSESLDEGERDPKTYQPAVTNTPPYYTPCITLRADLQREDLGRVEPRYRQPSRAENGGEEKDKEGSCDSRT